MKRQETKSCVVAALESCDDYGVRAEALRIILSGTDDDPVRNVLRRMAYAGVLEFYGGWGHDLTRWCLEREFGVARDLSTLEAQLLQTHDGSTTLKTETMKAELAQREAEIRALMDVDRRPRRQLPPGSRPDMTTLRALAILRRREMEDE